MPRAEQLVLPPDDFVLLSTGTPGSTIPCPEGTRGLLVGTAGPLNVTMSNGNDRDNVPMIVGINTGNFSAIRATVGTVANIWAVV